MFLFPGSYHSGEVLCTMRSPDLRPSTQISSDSVPS